MMTKNIMEHLHRINYLTAEINSLYHQAALRLGVADSVMHILYMLYDNEGTCMLADICKASGISKQTVNSAIRRLENEDIVYLQQQTGKTKKVCLTSKGRAYAEETAARIFAAEAEAYSDWTGEEISLHLKLLEKYADSFRKSLEEL